MPLIAIDVPEDVHRTLEARAALAESSLSDYVLREITRIALAPSLEELDERIRARTSAAVTTDEILEARNAGHRA